MKFRPKRPTTACGGTNDPVKWLMEDPAARAIIDRGGLRLEGARQGDPFDFKVHLTNRGVVPVVLADGKRAGSLPVDVVSDEEFRRIEEDQAVFEAERDAEDLDNMKVVLLMESTNKHLMLAARDLERRAIARRAEASLRVLELLLPKRIRDEEIGDAWEDLQRIVDDPGCPNLRRAVRWKLVSTWFWLLVHAVREIFAAIRGKKVR